MSEPLNNSDLQSHLPSQLPSIPPPQSPRLPMPVEPPKERSSVRSHFILLLGLTILLCVWILPWTAEQVAYALNRGIERAKADVARKLLAELPDAQQRISWVAKAVAPGVVGIHTIAQIQDRTGIDVGSGVIVDPKGYILTNYHVVAGAMAIHVRLNDGREVEAFIVGQDRTTDLAVLQINDDKLEAVAWGDSSKIAVGDQVVAIGNPYNLGQTVTSGIISATERYNPLPPQRGHFSTRTQEFLQTDAAINPGNSGGALVDLKGELIGINTAIFTEGRGNSGIGFAIPSMMAKKVYEEIVQHGAMKHGWLGIYMSPVTAYDAEQMKQPKPKGAVVSRFLPPHSPAKDAGIEVGDILLRWGETEISDPRHLSHLIVLSKPGTKETVEVFRNGKVIQLDVTLGTRPVEMP
jgi:S1-C subfamily serine protease